MIGKLRQQSLFFKFNLLPNLDPQQGILIRKETERQRDRKTKWQRDKGDKETEQQRHKDSVRQRDKKTEQQKHKDTVRQRDKKTELTIKS
jgi:hypothetical protein